MADDIYQKLAEDAEAITVERGSGFIFGADDLKNISNWSDQLIIDYLTKTDNLVLLGTIEQDIIDAIDNLRIRVEALEEQVAWLTPTSLVTSVNFTASGNQFIYCNNQRPSTITITLNAAPRDAERVWITQGGYHVIVSGNGRTINGDNIIKMNRQNQTRAIEYNLQLDEWVIV